MDALTLLAEARAAGLEVRATGDRLVVRGPKAAEPLARSLLDRKPEIMALLSDDDREIRWRAEAMRSQMSPSGPIPTMCARRHGPVPHGCCLSCGALLTPGNSYRCEPCVKAAWLVLREVRGGDEPDQLPDQGGAE